MFLIALGLTIDASGWPMNKQLWSPSYLFFMTGCCGCCLCIFYLIFDYTKWQPPGMRTPYRLPRWFQTKRLTKHQIDSVDGALKAMVAADETLAEGHHELRERKVSAASRQRLVGIKREMSIIRKELLTALANKPRVIRATGETF